MVDVNAKISLYDGVSPEVLRDISMWDFFTKTSEKLKGQVEAIRKADREVAKKLKSSLPSVTVSGTFGGARGIANLKQHSGFICIDIDDINDVENIKDILVDKFNFVVLAGKSVSGNGVFCVVAVDDKCTGKTHSNYFDYIKSEIEGVRGIKCDKSCRDVSRLRFYSYDERLVGWGQTVTPVSWESVEAMIKGEEAKRVEKRELVGNGDSDDRRFKALLQVIDSFGIDITSDRADWIKIGSAIANKYGEAGYDYFRQISSYYEGFKEHECRKQYDSFLRGKYDVSIGTIFYIADSYGVRLNG